MLSLGAAPSARPRCAPKARASANAETQTVIASRDVILVEPPDPASWAGPPAAVLQLVAQQAASAAVQLAASRIPCLASAGAEAAAWRGGGASLLDSVSASTRHQCVQFGGNAPAPEGQECVPAAARAALWEKGEGVEELGILLGHFDSMDSVTRHQRMSGGRVGAAGAPQLGASTTLARKGVRKNSAECVLDAMGATSCEKLHVSGEFCINPVATLSAAPAREAPVLPTDVSGETCTKLDDTSYLAAACEAPPRSALECENTSREATCDEAEPHEEPVEGQAASAQNAHARQLEQLAIEFDEKLQRCHDAEKLVEQLQAEFANVAGAAKKELRAVKQLAEQAVRARVEDLKGLSSRIDAAELAALDPQRRARRQELVSRRDRVDQQAAAASVRLVEAQALVEQLQLDPLAFKSAQRRARALEEAREEARQAAAEHKALELKLDVIHDLLRGPFRAHRKAVPPPVPQQDRDAVIAVLRDQLTADVRARCGVG